MNDGSFTWNLVSVLFQLPLTVSGTSLTLSTFRGDATQRWQFYQIPPPQGQLSIWTLPIQLPLVAIAITNLPDGRVLMWSSAQVDNYATGELQTYSAFYDPATGAVSQTLITSLQADMFCPGTALLFDGTALVVGGVTSGVTSAYNTSSAPGRWAWNKAARLNIRRGYNSAATLSDGRVFTLGGSWSGGYGGKQGEVWSDSDGWRLLAGVPPGPFLTEDSGGIYRQDNHIWLFAGPAGWVFHAGPSKAMHWVSTAGAGAVVSVGNRSDDGHAMNGGAVMYDVGRILTFGGAPDYVNGVPTANAYVIDITAGPGGSVTARRTGSMGWARAFHTGVALPSGEVVVVGGMAVNSYPFQDANSVLTAEIWSPATGRFAPLSWAPGATPMVTPRNYHSVALLLPDGRVLSSGGGACGALCMFNHLDAQIITPPYLLNPDGSPAARPSIVAAPPAATLGRAAAVAAAGVGGGAFALMRLGSSTHTVNTDQRRVPLVGAVVAAPDGSAPAGDPSNPAAVVWYSLPIPADPGVAVPGYYMLFALGPNGAPSVSKTIRLMVGGR